MKIITDYNLININQWHNYVRSHPEGSIFQSPDMYLVYRDSPNHTPVFVCCYDNSGEMTASLLAVILSEDDGLKEFFSKRSLIIGGPLVSNGCDNVNEELLRHYKSLVKSKVIYTQVRNISNTEQYREVFEKCGFKYEDHLNILLDLSIGEQGLLSNYSRSRRKGVKRGKEAGFTFTSSNNIDFLDTFYSLLSESYSRIKLPFPPKEHFEQVCNILEPHNYCFFGLKHKDSFVAVMLGLIYKKRIYGYYMGLTENKSLLRLRPSDIFFHYIFTWCIDKGIDTFDWMGAGKPDQEYGVRDFKLQFGGKLVNFGRYQIIHRPLLYKIASRGLRIWQKLH